MILTAASKICITNVTQEPADCCVVRLSLNKVVTQLYVHYLTDFLKTFFI